MFFWWLWWWYFCFCWWWLMMILVPTCSPKSVTCAAFFNSLHHGPVKTTTVQNYSQNNYSALQCTFFALHASVFAAQCSFLLPWGVFCCSAPDSTPQFFVAKQCTTVLFAEQCTLSLIWNIEGWRIAHAPQLAVRKCCTFFYQILQSIISPVDQTLHVGDHCTLHCTSSQFLPCTFGSFCNSFWQRITYHCLLMTLGRRMDNVSIFPCCIFSYL